MPRKECLSNRVGGFASEKEGKQAKSFLLPCLFMWVDTRRYWGVYTHLKQSSQENSSVSDRVSFL